MSIWDHVKRTEQPPQPIHVELTDGGRILKLQWDDRRSTSVSARVLRQLCPCAECVDEWTRKRSFEPDAISPDVRVEQSRAVGNYALGFRFSDGHSTGIFHWTFLRETSEKNPAAV